MNASRKWIFGLLAAVMLFAVAFAAFPAKAADGTWNVRVVHEINGRKLGLSKELPVNIIVYKDGAVLAYINNFTFQQRFYAPLPAGEYKIEVFSQELGVVVPSMTLGPVMITEGADLLIRAELKPDKTPVLTVIPK
jgi:hypothetical protein